MGKKRKSDIKDDQPEKKIIKSYDKDKFIKLRILNFIHFVSILKNIKTFSEEATIQLVNDQNIIITSECNGIMYFRGNVSCTLIKKTENCSVPLIHNISLQNANIKNLLNISSFGEMKIYETLIKIKVKSNTMYGSFSYTYYTMNGTEFNCNIIDMFYDRENLEDIVINGFAMNNVLKNFVSLKPNYLKLILYEEEDDNTNKMLKIKMDNHGKDATYESSLFSFKENNAYNNQVTLDEFMKELEPNMKKFRNKVYISSASVTKKFLNIMDGFSTVPKINIYMLKEMNAPILIKYVSNNEKDIYEICMSGIEIK